MCGPSVCMCGLSVCAWPNCVKGASGVGGQVDGWSSG